MWCQSPGRSVNLRSTIFALFFLPNSRTAFASIHPPVWCACGVYSSVGSDSREKVFARQLHPLWIRDNLSFAGDSPQKTQSHKCRIFRCHVTIKKLPMAISDALRPIHSPLTPQPSGKAK